MMSMENLSLIMIGLVVAVVAAGAAYVALRVWAGRMVDEDHPDPRSRPARARRGQPVPAAVAPATLPARRSAHLSAPPSANLEARHQGPVV